MGKRISSIKSFNEKNVHNYVLEETFGRSLHALASNTRRNPVIEKSAMLELGFALERRSEEVSEDDTAGRLRILLLYITLHGCT